MKDTNNPSTHEDFIIEKIRAFEIAEDWIPGIKLIQSFNPFQNLYICSRGIKKYGLTKKFFSHLPLKEFQNTIFDPSNKHTILLDSKESDAENYRVKKFYIQYSNIHVNQEVELIVVDEFFNDAFGSPKYKVIMILPLYFQAATMTKTKRYFEEIAFQRENNFKYYKLTMRNREVLSLWAKSLKAEEIGNRLFIGVNSVNSHKKRIKELLDISENAQIIQYGMAFDLL